MFTSSFVVNSEIKCYVSLWCDGLTFLLVIVNTVFYQQRVSFLQDMLVRGLGFEAIFWPSKFCLVFVNIQLKQMLIISNNKSVHICSP